MSNHHGFTPRRDHLLLDPIDEGERVTASGVVIPGQPSLAKQQPRVAKVVARNDWSEMIECSDGERGASKLEVDLGATVIWDQALAHYKVTLPDEHGHDHKYVLVEYDRILAEVPEGTVLLGTS